MKNSIKKRAEEMKQSNDKDVKKLGKLILKKIDRFKCYFCLDTGLIWDERTNRLLSRWDGRGDYDVKRCHSCSNYNWVRCSHNNEIYVNNIGLFKSLNYSVADRINQLRNIYKELLLRPEATWSLYKKKEVSIKTKEINLNINIKKLADAIFSSVKLYAGDILEIASVAKNMVIDINASFTEDNQMEELVKVLQTPENKPFYYFFKMEKKIKERNIFGKFFKSKKFTFKVTYIMLMPSNKEGIDICNDIVSDTLDSKIDKIDFLID